MDRVDCCASLRRQIPERLKPVRQIVRHTARRTNLARQRKSGTVSNFLEMENGYRRVTMRASTCLFPSLAESFFREVSAEPTARKQCAAALAEFHYLGWGGAVGENLQFAVSNEAGRLLACMVFGAPAWKCRARDAFIGWTAEQRQRHLHRIVANTRFLILPFVAIPHLASWTLGQVLRRLSADWKAKYGHTILLAETFVDRERFRGTCYRAASWIRAGSTAGRGRQDRFHALRVPIKDVYVYPLDGRFRQQLCQ